MFKHSLATASALLIYSLPTGVFVNSLAVEKMTKLMSHGPLRTQAWWISLVNTCDDWFLIAHKSQTLVGFTSSVKSSLTYPPIIINISQTSALTVNHHIKCVFRRRIYKLLNVSSTNCMLQMLVSAFAISQCVVPSCWTWYKSRVKVKWSYAASKSASSLAWINAGRHQTARKQNCCTNTSRESCSLTQRPWLRGRQIYVSRNKKK